MKKKYEEIVVYIENLIRQNQLKQGEKLPVIRKMAIQFSCNKSTVIRAYHELELNHIIYSIPKSGYYLVENNNHDNDKQSVIDFSEVVPDSRLLPYREFNHCINKAVELYKNQLFSYCEPQGLQSLRNVLEHHLREYQLFTSPENIIITNGAQQALNILSRMPYPNGKKKILVEQPTYRLMLGLVELNGDRLIGIKRNNNGIDLNELESIFMKEDVKFFYTMPRFQNPLGTNYSEKEKLRIVELADKYDVYIVEDDYLADINTKKNDLPAYYYDISHRVIYVKSFSKTFMPGIRIGVALVNEKLREDFLKYKRNYDLNTSVLAQGALEIFIKSGMYNNHIKKVQLQYKKKMDCLRDCLNHLNTDGIEVMVPVTGFFVWITMKKKINMTILINSLSKKNIFISPGKEYFIDKKADKNSIRVCISKLTRSQIRVGIQKVIEEIHRIGEK